MAIRRICAGDIWWLEPSWGLETMSETILPLSERLLKCQSTQGDLPEDAVIREAAEALRVAQQSESDKCVCEPGDPCKAHGKPWFDIERAVAKKMIAAYEDEDSDYLRDLVYHAVREVADAFGIPQSRTKQAYREATLDEVRAAWAVEMAGLPGDRLRDGSPTLVGLMELLWNAGLTVVHRA